MKRLLMNGVEQPTFDTYSGREVKRLAKDGMYMLETQRDRLLEVAPTIYLIGCVQVGVQEFRSLSLTRNSANMIRQGRYLIAFCGLVQVLKFRTGDDYVSAITDYTTLKARQSRL
jgi:hypothetical protein